MASYDDESSGEQVEVAADEGATCRIREQIIHDPASGLTFQFELDSTGFTRFRIFGDAIPFGNREIAFSPDGMEAAVGTATKGLSRPTWAVRVSDAA